MSSYQVNPEITIEEAQQLYETRVNAAITEVGKKGFTMPPPPQWGTPSGVVPYRGELPTDLTVLTDDQLGMYMGLLSEWLNYVQMQLAEASTQQLKAKSSLAAVEAKLRIAYRLDEEKKKRSNPERDDHVGADRRFIEAQANLLYWETMYRYINAIAQGADNAFTAVSRRITQRGQDIERERRAHNQTGGHIPQGAVFGRRS